MATIIHGSDTTLEALVGKQIAMIGYGNQGRPQALNLRDSGLDVIVGLYRESQKWEIADADGFPVFEVKSACEQADIIMLCLPDEKMAAIYSESVASVLKPGKTLAFCHGFNIRFGYIHPPTDVDVILIGPKGTGPSLRANNLADKGTPAFIAVHQNATGQAMELAKSYANAVCAAKSFLIETSFSDETEADLFGEQTILCGGIPELIKHGMAVLMEAGISPEVAYFECLSDAKLVLDLLYERGFEGMRRATSATAQWGGLTEGPFVVDKASKERMEQVLARIRDGSFARNWMEESKAGSPNLEKLRNEEASLNQESISTSIRSMMKP